MKKNKIIHSNLLICVIALCSITAYAKSTPTSSSSSVHDASEPPIKSNYDEVISEFYAYAGTMTPEIRQEITEYRSAIAALNKKKYELYDALSYRAREFLVRTQNYKKKLQITKQEGSQ